MSENVANFGVATDLVPVTLQEAASQIAIANVSGDTISVYDNQQRLNPVSLVSGTQQAFTQNVWVSSKSHSSIKVTWSPWNTTVNTGAVQSVSNAFSFPEAYGAFGDGVTDDTQALLTWHASGKRLALTPGKTYIHRQPLLGVCPPGTVLDGHGATLKRAPQAITTTTTTITAGTTNQISVAAISGGSGASAWSFQVSDLIVVENSGYYDQNSQVITSITGTGPYTITISGAFGNLRRRHDHSVHQ